MTVRILHGDCLAVLPTLAAGSVQCCVTSPPYFGLRDYGVAGQLGLEPTPDAYVAALVAVFREVRRVLADAGTVWLNLGDSYASGEVGRHDHKQAAGICVGDAAAGRSFIGKGMGAREQRQLITGLPSKNLLMIPARVALALQADGWWLRSDIIWAKPNPMPESVTDRPTSAHEHVFLLTKQARYYYDADAVAERSVIGEGAVRNITPGNKGADKSRNDGDRFGVVNDGTRNLRNVWTIATQPYAEAHFATFPPELAERCIKAGSRPGDTVLDPFSGAGTTALVADRLGRHAVGIELNPVYAVMARNRLIDDAPLLAEVAD